MENIVFDNELLNKYFKDVVSKEEFTVEDLNSLHKDYKYVSSSYIGSTLSQHDLDILLSLNEVTFRGINFENLDFKDEKMDCLTLIDCNTQNLNFENYELNNLTLIRGKYKNGSLEQFTEINGIKRLKIVGEDIPNRDKILSEYPNYNNLPQEEKNKIYFNPENRLKQEMNLEGLSKFKNLQNLNLNNMILTKEIESFLEYPNLEFLTLDDNDNIGVESLESLEKLVKKGIFVSFKNTDAEKFLSDKEYIIEDEQIEERIKRIFGISSYDKINLYNIFVKTARENTYIKEKDVFNTMVETGLIDLLKTENIKLELDTILDIDMESIYKLRNKLKSIEIKSFRGITSEVLDELEGLEWSVDGDLLTSGDNFYTSEDMKKILQAMDTVKNTIPKDASELEKFLTVYKSIGVFASYDRSGNIGNENFSHDNNNIVRSLMGVLIDGRAVCAGYKLALKYLVDYVAELECNEISGYAYGDPNKGHGWNQVKIDGIYYNADLTWDYRTIQAGEKTGTYTFLENCLKGDEDFYKKHTPHSDKPLEICEKSYNPEIIRETLQRMRQTQLDKSSFDATKYENPEGHDKKVTPNAIKGIALKNGINHSTIPALAEILRNDIETTNKREIIEH